MPPDLIQQLRDIHEPAAPGFWPLSISWWVLFSLVFVLLIGSVVWIIWRNYRLAPYKRIRNMARELTDRRESGAIDALTYASGINLLFKELLVDVESRTESTTAFGTTWQDLLADRFNEQAFISGSGACLGNARFVGSSFSDEGLSGLVHNTLYRVKPSKELVNA
ncbi:MAG: DUF4381 domain-containing protein [Gammaproteobacteria bacterium]|nr:DUF4381 domain-containing protein [Gammaproteobacteria bacterium]MYF03306.1 DUF4381 domain-containing protein [Gammaproteobacteria bacterium]MYI77259.1 DUF4381 domain-containing protein [Gammaproteobacteria bacterium]